LEEPQLAQEESVPVDDDLNLCPAEKPKEDIFFIGFFEPHAGHSGLSSLLKTRTSNSFPHFLHTYSYMGIAPSSYCFFFFFISFERSKMSFFSESV
jgi:hypothetical protein